MEIKRQSVAFNILRNFKETGHIMTAENVVNTINDNFNKGLIDELTVEEAFEQLDNLLEKGHKYYKREGSPGNYKYYYTEAEYKKKVGGSNIVDNVNNGEIINSLFKEWNSIKTSEQHKKWAKKVANTKFGTYKDKTILNVMSNFNPKFPNEIIKKDFINEVQRAYKNSGEAKGYKESFENEIKVGDKVKGSSGITKEKKVEEKDKSPLEIIKEFEDNTKFLNNKIKTLQNKIDNENLSEDKVLKIKKDIKTFSDKISFNDEKINSLRGKVEPGSHLKDNMTIGELAASYTGKKNGDYNMQKYIQNFVKKQIDLPKDSKIYFDGVDLVLNDKVISKDALKTNKTFGDIIKDVKNKIN